MQKKKKLSNYIVFSSYLPTSFLDKPNTLDEGKQFDSLDDAQTFANGFYNNYSSYGCFNSINHWCCILDVNKKFILTDRSVNDMTFGCLYELEEHLRKLLEEYEKEETK